MINKQYSITQAPDYWTDIIQRIEQGYSIKLTQNNEIIATLVPTKNNQPNFWQALQTFRQQIDITDLYDEDIFNDVRDRSPGREVLL
ncbi:hypothetical protein QUF50_03535 [Thiotrichales bacterium HSG1]|nr:hypothetical protein [Thiotrichales bacterium HSG1]